MKVMKEKHLLMVAAALLTMVVATVAADDQTLSYSDCIRNCGGVEIPYPFGIGDNTECFLSTRFKLYCNESKLYVGNLRVSNISFSKAQIDVFLDVSEQCGVDENKTPVTLMAGWLTIANKENKFITVGNDSFGFYNSYIGEERGYTTGCLTISVADQRLIDNGTCSGIGCCQVDIPPRMWNISIQAYKFNTNNISSESSETCSYSFVNKNDNYTFYSTHLSKGGFPLTESPVVLDWTVGEYGENCNTSTVSSDSYACKDNSYCDNNNTDYGYRCRCNTGYEGNPYKGCTDIDECARNLHLCKNEAKCNNTAGNYTCVCPSGHLEDGSVEGGCQHRNSNSIILLYTVLGVGATFILLFVGTFSYIIYHKRKFIKLREKFFKQNGGLILKQELSTREDSSKTQSAEIFTQDQLNKATKNFDESSIIGKGGFGTVFKGVLSNKRIVAIKKSKTIDKSQIAQFINEVVILSQINHRNVVKLLGCCLETEVPLLVYEFVSNGTLSDFIHKEKVNNETWKIRLRIAAEVAGALSYLHSAATIPIIHRDVKSDNILLDKSNTAKVSDFGASRLVPLDQTEIATIVQGTIGYLDPEYMQTSQLTEKSDVYSFGAVLVELLTGEKPFCIGRPEDRRSFAMHFLSCLKRDSVFDVIQDGILNEENKQEIKEVSVLAANCMRLRGEERPSMKEVAMELEGIRLMEKHSWINDELNVESQYLLHESSSSIYETGDSSKHGDIGYDSLKDHELIAFDDGR